MPLTLGKTLSKAEKKERYTMSWEAIFTYISCENNNNNPILVLYQYSSVSHNIAILPAYNITQHHPPSSIVLFNFINSI